MTSYTDTPRASAARLSDISPLAYSSTTLSLRPYRYDLTAYGAFRAYREGVLSLREGVFFEREGDLMPALAKRAWNALGAELIASFPSALKTLISFTVLTVSL